MAYLGVDVGGSKVALRMLTEHHGEYEAFLRWPSADGVGQDLEALGRCVRDLLRRCDEPVISVGVAMPATVGRSGQVLAWPNRPHWQGLWLGEALAPLFPGADVCWADDGDLAALAEARTMNQADLLYVGVGTGIGGGMVLGDRLCPGSERGSFEIGHMTIDRLGPRCACGRRGCVQAVASGPATLARAQRMRGSGVSFADLVRGIGRGESWASAAVDESCAALAIAVANVCELLHPSMVVIGGGFAAPISGFAATVAARMAGGLRPERSETPVKPAALEGLSSLYGAVLLAKGDA
ncbi:kanosamine 6-kinase [Micromonospora pisi]|uniref:Kanosamine 6-kinase n=1 Tax=Micromonospora pisi TaxID=589240 RepID=A0A495JTP6_9ACTN|nr:ROK family protein [Micromonospora pisi]RKR91918.1 kanosamine 6-kinase [Micromonospora pisi]